VHHISIVPCKKNRVLRFTHRRWVSCFFHFSMIWRRNLSIYHVEKKKNKERKSLKVMKKTNLRHICLKSSCMLLELLLPTSRSALPLAVFISKLISNNCTPKSKSKNNNTSRYQNWNQTNLQRIWGFCGFDTSIPLYNLDFGFLFSFRRYLV
jgi:hypothetical protein